MQILLHDANIIIDLLSIDLLDILFKLPYQICTTDFVMREVYKGNEKKHLAAYGKALNILTSTPLQVQNISILQNNHLSLSFADCSVLYHAQQKKATIVSGDKALRKTAEQYKVPVRGILWILDELLKQKLINRETAITKLRLLCKINSRLPRSEIETLIKKWGKEGL